MAGTLVVGLIDFILCIILANTSRLEPSQRYKTEKSNKNHTQQTLGIHSLIHAKLEITASFYCVRRGFPEYQQRYVVRLGNERRHRQEKNEYQLI